jgi:hypothetical protein
MTGILDDLLVLGLLLLSVAYATLTLGPRAWRRTLAQRLQQWLAHAPAVFRRPALMTRLQRVGAASACGGCDSCGDSKPAAKDAREVNVPIATIGRRR